MSDLALLGTRFVTEGADQTNRQLDVYAANANKAADASDRAAGGGQRLSQSMLQMLASIEKSTRQLVEITAQQRQVAQAAEAVAVAENRAAASAQAATVANVRYSHSFTQVVSDANAASAAIDRAGDAATKAAGQAKVAAAHFDTMYDAAQNDFAQQYVRQMGTVAATNDGVAKSMRSTRLAGVDLGRQLADVGVQAAMMTNPLMILVMQGPQIVDRLTDMKAQGISLSAAMKSLAASTWAALAPLAPFVLAAGAVAGVIGGSLALAARNLNKDNKDLVASLGLTEKQLDRLKDKGVDTGVTIGDVFKGTFDYIRESVAPSLAPIGKWFSDLFDEITAKAIWAVKTIGGAFVGAYAAIKATWSALPAALGDIAVQAGNAVVRAIESTINKALEAYNKALPLIRALMTATGNGAGAMGLREAGPVSLGQMDNPWSGAAEQALAEGASAFKEANEGWSRTVDSVGAGLRKSILDATRDRLRAAAGDAEKAKKSAAASNTPRDTSDERAAQLAQMLAQAQAEELRAQLDLTEDVRARAEIEKAMIDTQLAAQRAQLDRQAAAIADDRGLSEANKALLLMQLEAVKVAQSRTAGLKQDKIDRDAARKTTQDENAIRTAGLENEIDILASQGEVAKYGFQRREIDRQILAIQQRIERLKLEEIVATTASTSAEHQIAKERLKILDKIHGNQRQGAMGTAEDAFNDVARALEDAARAFEAQDWQKLVNSLAEAFGSLVSVMRNSESSLDSKIGAIAGVASVVGQAVGGKTGSTISGAASGAMAGLQLGGPVGAAIGAVVGGVAGWLSGDKAEKARKNAEAMKRAEEELARVRELAAKRLDLEIELLDAQGRTAEAIAARRKAELNAMDASLRSLQQLVWAEQDLAEQRQKAVDAAQLAVDDARNRLQEAYNAEAGAIQGYIDRFKGWSESLKSFLNTLYRGPAAMLSPEEQYKAARAEFDRVSAGAAAGDENAIRDLESVSQAYLDASKEYFASSKEYFADLERVRSAVTATQEYAASQVDVGQQQLAALNASVSGILQVNQSVLSVRDALAAYQAAVVALAQAQAAAKPAANDNVEKAADWGSYIANNSDVAAEYLRNMGSEKGRKYLAGLGIGSIEQFGQWHWNTSGKSEGRTPYARGGIIDRPLTIGESGIAGENGKESIMPLANVGGKMGVHAVGADQAESVELLKALVRQQQKMIEELKADKVQRAAIDEENAKRSERIENELERVARTKAAA